MPIPFARAAAALLVLLPAAAAPAGVFDAIAPDTDWTLFHPTPRTHLRPVAEHVTPTTTDAGHAQIDVDVVDVAVRDDGGMSAVRVDVLGFKARVGLTRGFEARLEMVPFRETRTRAGGTVMASARGLGDATLGVQVNLWGNDGGPTAAGLAPFLRIPIATGGVGTGALEGGVTIPIGVRLPAHVTALVIGEVEFADNILGGRGVHPRFALTASLERRVVGPVGLKVGWFSVADAEGGRLRYRHEVDADGAVAIGRDLVLHVGAAVAMPEPAHAINPYLRVSYRR